MEKENKKTIVSLIVSHNSRIQCLLDRINPNTGTKKRFQNCAILRLSINESEVDLSLVYSGELSQSEMADVSLDKPYYSVENKSNKPGYVPYIFDKIVREEYQTEFQKVLKNLNLTMMDLMNNTFVFYIVRHGQAAHNNKTDNSWAAWGMERDTSVTEEGKYQASRAGVALFDILTEKKEIIQNWFSSDLVRTRETIFEIITK